MLTLLSLLSVLRAFAQSLNGIRSLSQRAKFKFLEPYATAVWLALLATVYLGILALFAVLMAYHNHDGSSNVQVRHVRAL